MKRSKKKILFKLYNFLKREMEREEILNTLQQLGLTLYEAKAYSSLVLFGPSSANDLSKIAEVPRSKIYDVLASLMSKQMVEVLEERPKRFRAIQPEAIVKSMIEKKEEELKSLKEKVGLTLKKLKPLFREEEVLNGIWEQRGEKALEVLDRLAEMIERAQSYVYGITRDFSFSSRLREAIKKALKRKVKIRVMCMGINKENFYRAKWYYEQKIPIRVFEAKVHPRIIVADGKEVCIRLDADPSSRKFRFRSIWSSDPSFVAVMDSYMKNLWKMAKPVDFKNLKF